MSNNKPFSCEELAIDIINRILQVHTAKRFFLGIAGGPASGKSTLSAALSKNINRTVKDDISIVVPMDGFHLPNQVIISKGIHHLKGIPESFDADGFVYLLERLHFEGTKTVACPEFNREINEPTNEAILVQPRHKLIIVEGNYLLLNYPPWNRIRSLLDEVWYIEAPVDDIIERLLVRHMAGGRTRNEALQKIICTDLPNALLVENYRDSADRIISIMLDKWQELR